LGRTTTSARRCLWSGRLYTATAPCPCKLLCLCMLALDPLIRFIHHFFYFYIRRKQSSYLTESMCCICIFMLYC
jgi:hypothetical protein